MSQFHFPLNFKISLKVLRFGLDSHYARQAWFSEKSGLVSFLGQDQFKIKKILVVVSQFMNIWRVLLAIIFPPLAVLDKGCGSVLLVFVLSILGWIPGVIAALIILNNPNK